MMPTACKSAAAALIALLTSTLSAQSNTSPAQPRESGVSIMCRHATERYLVEWGAGYSDWIVKQCLLSLDEKKLQLSIENTLEPRIGEMVFERIAPGFYRGEFRTQTSPGESTYWSGPASLRFTQDGIGIGQWSLLGGWFVAGKGPLSLRPMRN